MRHLWLMACALLACGGDSDKPAPASTSTAVVTAVPTATMSAAPKHPHEGAWQGAYVAAKNEVQVPKKAKWKAWEQEEGSDRTGKGDVSITVSSEGLVQGTVSGALGELRVLGTIEKGALRAGVTPVDPVAPYAMTGVLAGDEKAGVIEADLTLSSHDGNAARKASVKLEKRP
jgi:hypothetical protein